jgi:methionine-gamma-lyase
MSVLHSMTNARAHISPELVRMSIGYTGILEQRWQQLTEALSRLAIETEKIIA